MAELRVVATAGHVDHGKSSLIVRLTGIDPDRWAEEKRRGLTIDLGLRLGDAPERARDRVRRRARPRALHPQHARRRRAGAARPVRRGGRRGLEAAVRGAPRRSSTCSGWPAACRAHEARPGRRRDARARRGRGARARSRARRSRTRRSCPVSAHDRRRDRRAARPRSTRCSPAPPSREPGRPRLFVDRVFTIKGAGTVVTGTLTGDCLTVGDEVELLPAGRPRADPRAADPQAGRGSRVPGERGSPPTSPASSARTSRAATSSATPARGAPRRRSTPSIRPVRGLAHAVTDRGRVHACTPARPRRGRRLRFLGPAQLDPGGEAFVRVRLSHPLVLDAVRSVRAARRGTAARRSAAGPCSIRSRPCGRAPTPTCVSSARASRGRRRPPGSSRPSAARCGSPRRTGSRDRRPRAGSGSAAGSSRDDLGGAVERSLAGHLEAFHATHPLEEGARSPERATRWRTRSGGRGAPRTPG